MIEASTSYVRMVVPDWVFTGKRGLGYEMWPSPTKRRVKHAERLRRVRRLRDARSAYSRIPPWICYANHNGEWRQFTP